MNSHPQAALTACSVMVAKLKLTRSDVISITMDHGGTEFHVLPAVLVSIFQTLDIRRSAVTAKVVGEWVHIRFSKNSFHFDGLVSAPEAERFMALDGQRKIESSSKKQPRIEQVTQTQRKLEVKQV